MEMNIMFKLWYFRNFKVIENHIAHDLNLKHVENIYGDMINYIGCRSIFTDKNGRYYRVKNLEL